MASTRSVAIVTDSTSDIPADLAAERGITVVPLNIHFGEDVFQDNIDISTDEFMRRMAGSDKLPTTSQPSVGLFEESFERVARETGLTDILCITISSKLSGTYQSATIAAQNLSDRLRITVIDSATGSYGLGFMVLEAADQADKGAHLETIAASMRDDLDRYHVVFFVETLEHLHRGGRIGKATQLVGTMLQLKPLLRVDAGQIVPFERTRTRRKAIRALEEFAREVHNPERLAVLYNTTPDDAHQLAETVSTITPENDVSIIQLGPVIATHLGPDVLGIIVKESPGE